MPPPVGEVSAARLVREVMAHHHERGGRASVRLAAITPVRRHRRSGGHSRFTGQPGGQGQHPIVGQGRAEDHQRRGAAVAGQAGGNDRRAEVEQVTEMRVMAERGVGGDGIGQHLVYP